MTVSAIIVTRGDVDLDPCLDPLPTDWELLVWDNGHGFLRRMFWNGDWWQKDMSVKDAGVIDRSVYGRYAAIEYASHDLIYVQDDDVIVSDPQAIVGRWEEGGNWPCRGCNGQRSALCADCEAAARERTDHLVANMPQEFRHDGYTDSCLVGFGACFHRDAPERAFERFFYRSYDFEWPVFRRTCDVVFTTLTPRVLVDVPKQDREFASAPNRMWKQPTHYGERTRMLELARKARDS